MVEFIRSARITGLGLAALVACGCSNSNPVAPPVDTLNVSCPMPIAVTSPIGDPMSVVYGSTTTTGGTAPVTTTCTPASGSTFSVGTTAVTCTATDAKQKTSACTFNVQVFRAAQLGASRFLAFGDSLTRGEDGIIVGGRSPGSFEIFQVHPEYAYPTVLGQELTATYTGQSISVANGGLTGETVIPSSTFDAPRRLNSLLSSSQYDVVLLMEGTNDLAARDAHVYPSIIANLRRMIDDSRGHNVRPYLATLPPEDKAGFRGVAADEIPVFNQQIAGLALQEGIPLVDVYAAFGPDYSHLIGTLLENDGLHPTAGGYKAIADKFFEVIRATLGTQPSLMFFPARAGITRLR